MGNKEGISHLPWVWDRPKKISSCLPQQKKSRHRSTYIHTHSTPTITNSWRRRQTRRELISPTRSGLQGEKERRGREIEELFLPMCGSQACRPLIPLTLTPSSVTPNGMFLFISLSLSPSISICRPPPCRISPFLSSTASLHRCLRPLRCFRCVTSVQTAGEQAATGNQISGRKRAAVARGERT